MTDVRNRHYRVRALNGAGAGHPSNTAGLPPTRLSAPPLPTRLAAVTVLGISPTEIDIRVNVFDPDGSNLVVLRHVAGKPNEQREVVRFPLTEAGPRTFRLDGLTPSTTYRVELDFDTLDCDTDNCSDVGASFPPSARWCSLRARTRRRRGGRRWRSQPVAGPGNPAGWR